MDVSNMLSHENQQLASQEPSTDLPQGNVSSHQYPTRRSTSVNTHTEDRYAINALNHDNNLGHLSASWSASAGLAPKNVTFELHFDGAPNVRGRLPMRVQIFPHDNTESIVRTVKNFYGLYDGASQGVSFEDVGGKILVANYDNFVNDMIVYVRVVPEYAQRQEYQGQWGYQPTSPQAQEEPQPMLPPQPAQILSYGQVPSRPESRVSRKQSASPKLSQGRAGSIQMSRSRSGKGQRSSFQAALDELNSDAHNGYSSSDGGAAGSVTSSRKARSEQLASAEISVDNIVEGGRRKRAKFESSELPLFVPPQVPAPNSISSISPQRRSNGVDVISPFSRPPQRSFTYNVPIQSPQEFPTNGQSHSAPQSGSGFTVPLVPNHGHRLRDRSSGAPLSARSSLGSGNRSLGMNTLPTPDPTIASCISDEDVALQLMRLGDASNFSLGRTSASTFDDALSGKADAASSATSESDDESEMTENPLPVHQDGMKSEPGVDQFGPPPKKQRRHLNDAIRSFDSHQRNGDELDGDYEDPSAKSEADNRNKRLTLKPTKVKKSRAPSTKSKASKSGPKKGRPAALASGVRPPMSPTSLPPTQSRKESVASTMNSQVVADEDDLSTKPRCQRCRKSKKGCNRQRPCQRCKDAGIGVDGCISEDEGNTRKGRYGRHMGISLKKTTDEMAIDQESETAGAILGAMASGGQGAMEKGKKRKR